MATEPQKSAFTLEVEKALKHYQDKRWLGAECPLASPYFLSTKLPSTAIDAESRGECLQQLLAETTAQIGGRYAERFQTIIREYYFRDRSVKEVCDAINLGHNSFHLNRNDAIEELSALLIAQMNPALRLETPPQHGLLLERKTLLQQGLLAIQGQQSLSLIGGGGMGKTSLGSQLASQAGRAVFWYTIRPGLNDQLSSLLFALGYFLHCCHSSTLWLELVAEGSDLKSDRVMAIARYALEQVTPRPLLCIDEADQLKPAEEASHVPLVRMLESMQGLAPILIIGQQPLYDTDAFLTLNGLSAHATQVILAATGQKLTVDMTEGIHQYTQGNPRLLELSTMLLRDGESATDLLDMLTDQPSVEFLLGRILQRLSETERALLLELAVFRRSAPAAIWQEPELRAPLDRLIAQRLVHLDTSGGVLLLPAYRTFY
ncbi:MAG: hypothetical protein R2932_33865 [Caldilineaceae bacterium]